MANESSPQNGAPHTNGTQHPSMVHYLTLADAEYGKRVAEGLSVKAESGVREAQLANR